MNMTKPDNGPASFKSFSRYEKYRGGSKILPHLFRDIHTIENYIPVSNANLKPGKSVWLFLFKRSRFYFFQTLPVSTGGRSFCGVGSDLLSSCRGFFQMCLKGTIRSSTT